MAESITLSELLAELDRLGFPPDRGDAGHTMRELQEQWGVGPLRATKVMRRLVAAGLVTPGRSYRLALDGLQRPVAVYRFKREASEASATKRRK